MRRDRPAPKDVDEYIAGFPKEVQKALRAIRRTIRKAAPGAEETIKYQMPTFTLRGHLVHFAAYKRQIGLYPAPRGVAAFKDELSAYAGEKATVRFPLDQPMPLDLIGRIVKFRARQRSEPQGARDNKR